MNAHFTLLNPFFDAYNGSDLLGKLIFLGLLALSVITWGILVHKWWLTKKVRTLSLSFRKSYLEKRKNSPLALECSPSAAYPNAFAIIYTVLKNKTLEIWEKNGHHSNESPFLTTADVALLETNAATTISSLTKYLEKNLFLLSTIATLAPFLGLLGTVWGILVTFSSMTAVGGGLSSQIVLGGLSLALTTTVIGLVDAIPALVGYNYLKHQISDFDTEMDRFATDVLSSLELSFRKNT
jgi:biopolymer transport protein TolQ